MECIAFIVLKGKVVHLMLYNKNVNHKLFIQIVYKSKYAWFASILLWIMQPLLELFILNMNAREQEYRWCQLFLLLNNAHRDEVFHVNLEHEMTLLRWIDLENKNDIHLEATSYITESWCTSYNTCIFYLFQMVSPSGIMNLRSAMFHIMINMLITILCKSLCLSFNMYLALQFDIVIAKCICVSFLLSLCSPKMWFITYWVFAKCIFKNILSYWQEVSKCIRSPGNER